MFPPFLQLHTSSDPQILEPVYFTLAILSLYLQCFVSHYASSDNSLHGVDDMFDLLVDLLELLYLSDRDSRLIAAVEQ